MERDHRLEPTRHGVGHEWNQLPCLDPEDQPLAFTGLEAVGIDFARGDLAVERAWKHHSLFRLIVRALAQRQLFLSEDLEIGRDHRLAGRFGQLSDMKHQGIRHASPGYERQFPAPGRGIGSDGDFQISQTRYRRTGRSLHIPGHALIYFCDQSSGGRVGIGRGFAGTALAAHHHHLH